MNRIGIDKWFHDVYESFGNIWRPVWPTPMMSYAKLDPELPIQGSFSGFPTDRDLIFREDGFDAVTRVRRGRLYTPGGRGEESVLPHPAHGRLGGVAGPQAEGRARRFLDYYDPFQLSGSSRPKIVALGSADSLWRVIGCERIMTGEHLFTLKARGTFGILPEVNPDEIPERDRAKAIETLEKLTEAAHRESPSSIIDRASDAAQWCLAAWAASEFDAPNLVTKTLDDLIKAIKNKSKSQVIATDAANIVRILHARGHPNVQEQHRTRPVMEDDAELALRAVGFLLREFYWCQE